GLFNHNRDFIDHEMQFPSLDPLLPSDKENVDPRVQLDMEYELPQLNIGKDLNGDTENEDCEEATEHFSIIIDEQGEVQVGTAQTPSNWRVTQVLNHFLYYITVPLGKVGSAIKNKVLPSGKNKDECEKQ